MKASRTSLALRVTLLVLGWSLGYPALSTPPATDVPSGFRLVGQSAAPAEGPVSGILRIDDQTLLTDAGDIYDLSEPTRPRRVATSAWHGAALEVQGSTGYLADGRDGLVLLDLRDLRQPARLGGYRTSGDARALEVRAGLVYVAAVDGGLRIIDAADPARTDQLGSYPSSLAESLVAHDLVLRGDLAYVAAGNDTLEVLRVTRPSAIQRVGGLRTDLDARWVASMGDRLLLAGESGGLLLVDIANPLQPKAVASFPRDANAANWSGILVDRTTCYVAAGADGILIIDWTEPTLPVLAGQYRASSPVSDLELVGGRIIAARGTDGFAVLEPVAHGPMAPRIIVQPQSIVVSAGASARFDVVAEPSAGLSFQWYFGDQPVDGEDGPSLRLAAVAGNQAGSYTVVVGNEGGTVRSAPATLRVLLPPRIASQPSDLTVFAGSPFRLAVSVFGDDVVEYQWFKDGLLLPGATRAAVEASEASPDHAGSYVVQIRSPSGMVLSDPAVIVVRPRITLAHLGRWPETPDGEFAHRLRIDGQLLHLAQGAAGLQVLDVSDPTRPRRVGGYFGGGYAGGFEIVGTRLYLADGHVGGLTVLDMASPTQPRRLSRVVLEGSANDVRIQGSHAYVACGIKGLSVVDISDPLDLRIVGRIPDSYGATRLDVAGNWAFMADAQGGLLIGQVGDPLRPFPVVQFAKPSFGEYSVRDVQVVGPLAFYTMTYDGLGIADVSDPARPAPVGHVAGYSTSVRVQSGYAYVGRADAGLRVVDVTTPSSPRVAADLDTPGEVSDVAVQPPRLYVADGKNGVLILESNLAPTPTRPRLAVERLPDGRRLRLLCPGEFPTTLERSTDLRIWVPVQTNPPSADRGTMEFMADTADSTAGGVFYRVSR